MGRYPPGTPKASVRPLRLSRKLPSGRYQARYKHEGQVHIAPETFRTRADASAWLSAQETDIHRGEWVDPAAGQVTFCDYAEAWRKLQVWRQGTSE
jgi:hypothetical protein